MAQELANAKAQLESALAAQRQEMTDLAIENERQGSDIEDRISAEIELRAELATLQGTNRANGRRTGPRQGGNNGRA